MGLCSKITKQLTVAQFQKLKKKTQFSAFEIVIRLSETMEPTKFRGRKSHLLYLITKTARTETFLTGV